jgi:hypothetical protein
MKGWDMGEPREPREPWNRERDDAAYREAVEQARPAEDDPEIVAVLARFREAVAKATEQAVMDLVALGRFR